MTPSVTKIHCKSLNFRLKDKSCDLNDAGKHAHPKDYGPKTGFIYWACLSHPRFVRLIHSQCFFVWLRKNLHCNDLSLFISLSLEIINMIRSIVKSRLALDTKNKRYIFFFSFFKLKTQQKFLFASSLVQQYSKNGLRWKVDIIE